MEEKVWQDLHDQTKSAAFQEFIGLLEEIRDGKRTQIVEQDVTTEEGIRQNIKLKAQMDTYTEVISLLREGSI